ncbi:HAMP domain-containing protein, partial [Halalkalibacterium halodurans]
MTATKKYRMSIGKKIALSTVSVSMITFGISALLILLFDEFFGDLTGVSGGAYIAIVLILGVIWNGILGYVASSFFIAKPLSALERSARKAAEGDIHNDVAVSKSDDEIRSLGLAYNEMLASLRSMVNEINANFVETDAKVKEMN